MSCFSDRYTILCIGENLFDSKPKDSALLADLPGQWMLTLQSSLKRGLGSRHLGNALRRNHFNLIGHDQAFFTDQGDAAVKEGRFVVFITDQFSSVQ